MLTIYGQLNCQDCNKAKMRCDMAEAEYEYKQLNNDFTREDLYEIAPKAKAFPVIFKDGQLIGGYADLVDLLSA